MQTLGLADSTPKPENRGKSLFWPAIRHEVDVDNITRQGFWICLTVAVLSLVLAAFMGTAAFVGQSFESVFFFLSGVGVRMRSVFAAVCAFLAYFIASFGVPFGFVRILMLALLLANIRGTWLSSQWRSTQTEPPPVPMNTTLLDKISDRLPLYIWPKGRLVYYFFAGIEALILLAFIYSKFVRE